jgi:invasion protein IalB
MRFKTPLRAVGIVSTLLWAVPGTADTLRNGDVVGDWKFSCVAISEGQASCALTQTILIEEGAPPLARITFERAVDPEQLVVSLFVPVGSELSFSPLLAAGDQGLPFPYIVCTSEGCLARTFVTVESLAPFLVSDQLAVIYKRYGVEGMVRIPASSNGLVDAFKSLGLM